LTDDHIHSLIHIGTFAMASLAKHTGMTQMHAKNAGAAEKSTKAIGAPKGAAAGKPAGAGAKPAGVGAKPAGAGAAVGAKGAAPKAGAKPAAGRK
jgi:hypothetical protein